MIVNKFRRLLDQRKDPTQGTPNNPVRAPLPPQRSKPIYQCRTCGKTSTFEKCPWCK